MPRVRKGATRARKHKKTLKAARGMIGAASRRYRVAIEAWLRAGRYATVGRKLRKRDFRRLWIMRISAACRQRGLLYSRFMHGLSEKGVVVNRKMLAEMAVADPGAFVRLVAVATSGEADVAAPVQEPPPEVAEAEKAPAPKERPAAKKPRAAKAATKAAKKPSPATKKAPVAKKAAAKPARKKPAATRKKTAAKKPKPDEPAKQ
jgi:large subunit ribosomal protein L20